MASKLSSNKSSRVITFDIVIVIVIVAAIRIIIRGQRTQIISLVEVNCLFFEANLCIGGRDIGRCVHHLLLLRHIIVTITRCHRCFFLRKECAYTVTDVQSRYRMLKFLLNDDDDDDPVRSFNLFGIHGFQFFIQVCVSSSYTDAKDPGKIPPAICSPKDNLRQCTCNYRNSTIVIILFFFLFFLTVGWYRLCCCGSCCIDGKLQISLWTIVVTARLLICRPASSSSYSITTVLLVVVIQS